MEMKIVHLMALRGQLFEGIVSSVGMSKSIIVELQKVRYMPKYERYEKRSSKIPAHLPSCIGELSVGDRVKIMECRPISKTVSFCVVEGGN